VFGGIPLPAPLPVPGGKLWGEAHEVLANLLLVAIAAHVLAALWHQFVVRDGALSRMLPMLGGRSILPPGS
jgi:cytochrome b561